MLDKKNKLLLLVWAILLAVAIWITLTSDTAAQGGGRCYVQYRKYWSPRYRRYITYRTWVCTGWQRPRYSRYLRH